VPVISILFERGKFDADATRLTAQVLGYYAVGLLPFAAVNVLAAAFYAHHDTRTPVKVGALTFFVHLGLNFWLRGPLLAGGIALSTSVSAILDMALLFYLFAKQRGPLWDPGLWKSLRVTLGASALMGLAAHAAGRLPYLEYGHSLAVRAAALGLVITACAGIFLAAARAMGSREVLEIIALVSRKPRGTR